MNKKILLGVTGGIAAYKSAELVRLLRKQGDEVRVVMTQSAQQFVTPITFQALSGQRVYTDLFNAEESQGMDHIHLARWADVILIAPASANVIAKIANGFADDLLTTLCLAAKIPVCIAPAMNQQMWSNEAVQANLQILRERKVKIFGPGEGEQACGEFGLGRMFEPEQLIVCINNLFNTGKLKDKKVLMTAGPTCEAIDPVRYLTNHSSGKMGYALAEAAAEAGAKVILISGPTQLECSQYIHRIDVISAHQMYQAVMNNIQDQDVFISVAAVADYRVMKIAEQKIKKSEKEMQLSLIRNPDILAEVAKLPDPPITIGFAAETENLVANAKAKLITKKLDMIIANQVGIEGCGFNSDNNSVTVITKEDCVELAVASKEQLARQLIWKIHNFIVKYPDNQQRRC